MTIEWRWHNDQHTIVCFTFQDPWTLDEFIVADTEAGQAVMGLQWKVDAIMDVSQAHIVPRNIVSGMVSMVKRSASVPNMGSSVVIYANPLFKTFVSVVQRLIPKDTILLAEDVEDAEDAE